MKNHRLFRDSLVRNTMSERLRKKDCISMIAKPMYILNAGQSFMGYSKQNTEGFILIFSCIELIKPSQALQVHASEWQSSGILKASFVSEILHPLGCLLRNISRNGFALLDINPNKFLFDTDRIVLSGLGAGAVFKGQTLNCSGGIHQLAFILLHKQRNHKQRNRYLYSMGRTTKILLLCTLQTGKYR